jgi:hypothetical protein
MTQLINNTYETGVWAKEFTEVAMTTLKRKPQKLQNVVTMALPHSLHILRRMTERKIEDVLADDQFGFRRGK